MKVPVPLALYEGELPYRDRACSVKRCSLLPGHDGPHAEISFSRLVIEVWDEPEVDASVIEVVQKLNAVRDDLVFTIGSARQDIRDMQRSDAALANPGLAELLEQASYDIEHDIDNVGLVEDESTWGTELQHLGAKRETKRRRRAA
ncbi:hypothetical protein QNA24_22290 [Rhodococcus qingshengii]|uniref:hypothetical protein n=1 Tax=Rhodococcus qingshengii TaxID=334542 RepID=UPI0024B8D927|nr:hypothetical protein [Rhodococcus qingshengii]MDJ0489110.1 hypothetical protein [Rhodococcus qingshengii]